ncbi:helix-turn-helix domain-containing protein [Yinghuangia seranimata]|uniref:helix-turn-helix domain-containing protein n=1 Tax=Yinghuangia seranimata TaxID=408067 RepID=UPI00248CD426|nr:helix-turn-helix domain-containing protein [Yinghuangia seranimata]MDI2132115.1 helix-turn-helix domain-containing protein [Yinghuangia seranimata]
MASPNVPAPGRLAPPPALSLTGRQPRAVRAALAVLEAVAQAGPGVTARQIATTLDLAPATAYRIVNLLVADEYLVRLPDLKGFALGRRMEGLAHAALPPHVPTAAREAVARLRTRTRWGVHLALYSGARIVLVDPDPDHPPSADSLLSARPNASALGKLLLAATADPRLSGLERDRIIADGHAAQRGELRAGHACLAVPVRGPADGALVAGLALSTTPERLDTLTSGELTALHRFSTELAPLLA